MLKTPLGNDGSKGKVFSLVIAYFFMSLCGAMTSIAISLNFATRPNGEALVATVLVTGACAQVFVSPLLTPFFDRANPFTVAKLGTIFECLTLIFLCGFPSTLTLIAGNIVIATLSGITIPAYYAIADSSLDASDQARAFSYLDTARLCGSFVGPILGGGFLDIASLRTVFALEALAVGSSIIVVQRLQRQDWPLVPSTSPHTLKAEAPSPLHSIVEAPKILLNNPRSRQALTSIWAAIIFTSIFNVALVFFATQSLNTSGFLYAVVAQCFVVGRILGARFSARLTKANALATLIKSGIGMGICISIPGFVPALFLCIPLFALAGMFNGLQVSALRIVVVSAVDPKIKPKALVTMGTINNSAMLVGYIVGAPTVSAAGPNAALIIAGLGTALFTALPSLWNKLTKPFLRSN